MFGLPISQAAIDLGLRSLQNSESIDEFKKRRKENLTEARTQMGAVATELFGGAGSIGQMRGFLNG